jgi:hypothetical protein
MEKMSSRQRLDCLSKSTYLHFLNVQYPVSISIDSSKEAFERFSWDYQTPFRGVISVLRIRLRGTRCQNQVRD